MAVHDQDNTATTTTHALKLALNKLNTVDVPQNHTIALAYSGGLDSTLCVKLAETKYHAAQLYAISVDVGQGADELNTSIKRAQQLGITPIVIDAKQEFTEYWLTKAIQANSDYNGYPVSTSMTRQLIAAKVAQKALELRCDALMEGSSGKGNDQYRMHNVFALFAPGLPTFVPVRDFDLTRGEEQLLIEHYGIQVEELIAGGDDKTMWCRSIASGGIDLDTRLPDEIWMWLVPPAKAPETPTTITLTWQNGLPIALNGDILPLDQIIEQLNVIGGANGIGKIDMFEDGIMGLKSREIYEAPAAQILLKVHHDLELYCLTKEEIQLKRQLDAQWSKMVYHGEWFHPLKDAIDAFIASTQKVVNGEYVIDLYKGNIDIVSRSSKSGLFFPDVRSIHSASFNQKECAPAAHLRGLPFELIARRNTLAGLVPEGA
ncbi:argininosuccinate synthase [Thermosporothrix hazakensis]|jgi:argininosuccinate synthase|uniref:argininosuccinate synthase n=1 Tax=Thermosporothrix hazakensis TaxID=644383 RepID=A0A326U3T8_THEHA|nr:argininosuccinate synthase [Thermosporothrix hazakensis]PZW25423.1 argininosuccinate synthase [Thermosporothrix hazakensis]GCE48808.1 argininosuccinate synthase [Thermosporothrix hazakensis]